MSVPPNLQAYLIELPVDGGPPLGVDDQRDYAVVDANGETIGAARVSNEGRHLRLQAAPGLIARMHKAFHVTPSIRGDEVYCIKVVDEPPTLD